VVGEPTGPHGHRAQERVGMIVFGGLIVAVSFVAARMQTSATSTAA
jgi:acyl-CoA thioesterase